jgi:hypothetical protein
LFLERAERRVLGAEDLIEDAAGDEESRSTDDGDVCLSVLNKLGVDLLAGVGKPRTTLELQFFLPLDETPGSVTALKSSLMVLEALCRDVERKTASKLLLDTRSIFFVPLEEGSINFDRRS